MRGTLIVGSLAGVALVGVVLLWPRSGAVVDPEASGDRGRGVDAAGVGDEVTSDLERLPARELVAGGVAVRIEPVAIDGSGAVFRVTLDTHSGSLDVDLVGSAGLEVGETVWPAARWEGDPPGGHHRQGELAFDAAGPVEGAARLTIGGLEEPIEAAWPLG